MYFDGGITFAKAAFTSGNSQVVGTTRSATVGEGEAELLATGLVEPHAVKENNRTKAIAVFFIINSLPD